MDIADIRRRRLRHWIDTDPIAAGNVEAWCRRYGQNVLPDETPITASYVRQLVPARSAAPREIGEKAARKLERARGVPPGSLDEPLDAPTITEYPYSITPTVDTLVRESATGMPERADPPLLSASLNDLRARVIDRPDALKRAIGDLAASYITTADHRTSREIAAALARLLDSLA